jgi:hypothetical protein
LSKDNEAPSLALDSKELESVHNVDTLWTDLLENRIFAAVRRENAMSVRKVTGFADRPELIGRTSGFENFKIEARGNQNAQGIEAEIPQAARGGAEELERIARSPHRGDAPGINPAFSQLIMSRERLPGNNAPQSNTTPNTAHCSLISPPFVDNTLFSTQEETRIVSQRIERLPGTRKGILAAVETRTAGRHETGVLRTDSNYKEAGMT